MFKGLGNIGNIASMMGAMQQLPELLQQLNDRMKTETVTMSSSCVRVTVVMSGIGQVQSIEIVEGTSGDELNQAVVDATNAAGAAAKRMYADAISQMAGDLDINVPGLDGMLAKLSGNA